MKTIITLTLATILTLTAIAKEGAVECGNVYAGNRTSRCFSDVFLTTVQQKNSIATERRFQPPFSPPSVWSPALSTVFTLKSNS